jgi:hypothetical protein
LGRGRGDGERGEGGAVDFFNGVGGDVVWGEGARRGRGDELH